jgi:hypothetical protein
MATHKVSTSGAELDRALEEAKTLPEELRVLSVEYQSAPELDLLILRLSDGSRRLIPRENIEGLREASPAQIAHVELRGQGSGLQWPELDLDLYVPALLQSVYGTKHWMAQLGRRGGKSTSAAKRQAARLNGRKGGRPKLAAIHS